MIVEVQNPTGVVTDKWRRWVTPSYTGPNGQYQDMVVLLKPDTGYVQGDGEPITFEQVKSYIEVMAK